MAEPGGNDWQRRYSESVEAEVAHQGRENENRRPMTFTDFRIWSLVVVPTIGLALAGIGWLFRNADRSIRWAGWVTVACLCVFVLAVVGWRHRVTTRGAADEWSARPPLPSASLASDDEAPVCQGEVRHLV